MPLESVLLLVDTSEQTRNSDYPPTRLSSQVDAANYLAQSIINGNPESTCGVLTMGGQPRLLTSCTDNLGKILNSLSNLTYEGKSSLSQSISVALLALKHRRNKNGRQRIITFVASDVENTEKEITKVGKLCKKNNVGIDIISLVPNSETSIQKLCDAANSNENSHLVTVPLGSLASDVLISSPITEGSGPAGNMGQMGSDDPELAAAMAASMNAGAGPPAGNDSGFDFDPNMDPELAMALRVSMEEERRRVENNKDETNEPEPMPTVKEDDDDLQKALSMSEGDPSMYEQITTGVTDEDEAMQLALAMSMAGDEEAIKEAMEEMEGVEEEEVKKEMEEEGK
ncbi:hypothetical protein TrVE_jg3511 [Triparma verrucosa]|uniref:VWFA domain-containing protein n=1 Tax=Triparma verrucosa TaxID=1606542 RepID=A0A9W7B818_9STRA|nr:hypothetical protein TrVE_jg3511 [Triparma verrucosa]